MYNEGQPNCTPGGGITDEAELLDIRQAAALLHVSAASLRRWSNAGLLASFRVGGRHERRFRRADLLAFLESHPAAAGHATAATPPDTAAHGHLCGLYLSDDARVRAAARFLADALRAGGVSVLAAEPAVRDRIVAQLERQWPAVPRDITAGRLELSRYADGVAAQLESWHTRFTAASGARTGPLHVVGDVSGGRLARHNDFAAVLEYEREYDRTVARRFAVHTLCLYDARTLSGVETAQLLGLHGDGFRHPVEQLIG
jgi:excisionase family DNA binding protein